MRVRCRSWGPALGAAALLWGLVPAVLEAGENRVELRDGSILSGELVGLANGRYRIRTAVMGEIEVDEADVLSIRPAGQGGAPASAPTAGGADYSSDIAGIQRQLAGDPGMLDSIMALQSDPEIQSALADPAFVGLILSGNVEALKSDPRFLRLLEHPALQAIVGRMTGR